MNSTNSKSKAISLLVLSSLAVLALAGCQPSNTTTTTTTGDTTATTDGGSTTATKEVGTPSNAKNKNNVEAAGNKVTTYSIDSTTDKAFEDQAKMVKDAGWVAYKNMPEPIKAAGSVTQTFVSGDSKMMLVLVTTADPVNAGLTMVSMTQSANQIQ